MWSKRYRNFQDEVMYMYMYRRKDGWKESIDIGLNVGKQMEIEGEETNDKLSW